MTPARGPGSVPMTLWQSRVLGGYVLNRALPRQRKRPFQSHLPGAHPLIQALMQMIAFQGNTARQVAAEAGVTVDIFSDFRRGRVPRVDTLDALGEVCGYRLVWAPIKGETQ